MGKKINFWLVLIMVLTLCGLAVSRAFAQQFPSTETSGAVEDSIKQEKKQEAIIKQIETPKEEPEIEQEGMPPAEPTPPEEKFFVRKIIVTGSTILSQEEIDNLVKPYENKETSLRQLQGLTNEITELYRKKGYITSMSFIPPQRIEDDVIEIRVLEGKVGEVKIEGNKHFSTKLLRNRIRLKEGDFFDYKILQRCLQYINESIDITAKAIIQAGKKPGTTDVIVDVQDRIPIHIGFKYDNYGSRYTGYSRYDIELNHNNITGRGDTLSAEWQRSDANRYYLMFFRYIYPFNNESELGFSFNKVRVDLGKDYEDLDMIGKGKVYDLYYSYALVREERVDLNLNVGFEYKDMENRVLGDIEPLGSKDNLRIFRFGSDIDMTDPWGRTIVTGALRFGVDGIMGASPDKSRLASRSGARTKFNKLNLYLARVHSLPWDTDLLLRFSAQITPYIMCASEQFLIGGYETVRGYPRSERGGDEGMTASAEYSLPFYFLPKGIKIPFTKKSLYDALRVVLFYDWGRAKNRRVLAGDNKNYYLAGAGGGLRLNIADDCYVRFDVAGPVNIKPSNDSKTTIYVEAKKMF